MNEIERDTTRTDDRVVSETIEEVEQAFLRADRDGVPVVQSEIVWRPRRPRPVPASSIRELNCDPVPGAADTVPGYRAVRFTVQAVE